MTPDELPIRAYADAAWHARELEHVFRRAWVPLARSSELAEPGAWRSVELAGSPLALVRGEDGVVRAFHDACRHRGARLLRAPAGCARELVCPYHAFRYGLDGRFAGAPEVAGVVPERPGALDLAPVRAEERAGWVWVSLDTEAPPLADFLGLAAAELDRWPLAVCETKERKELDVDFDWKIGVEAFLEPLHVPAIHARTALPFVDVARTRCFELGEHSGMAIPFRDPAVWTTGPLGELARAAGVTSFEGLDDEQRTHHVVHLLFPATILMLFPNHLLALTFLPLAPGRARLVFDLLAEPAADERAAAWYSSLSPGYAELLREDLENLPWIQRGVAGGSLERLALTDLERRIAWFRSALAARLRTPVT